MDSNKYLNDISEIKSLMNKSTRFLSLSGLSGVLAGIYALIGAGFAHTIIYASEAPSNESYKTIVLYETDMLKLFAIAFAVLVLSLITGIFFSYKKAKKKCLKNKKTSKKCLKNKKDSKKNAWTWKNTHKNRCPKKHYKNNTFPNKMNTNKTDAPQTK